MPRKARVRDLSLEAIRQPDRLRGNYFCMKLARLASALLVSSLIVSAQGSESPFTFSPTGTGKSGNESDAHLVTGGYPGSGAVDAKGVRHRGDKSAPWLNDLIQLLAPEYPYFDKQQRHEGVGLFRLTLDIKKGLVTKVETLGSTGFVTLDRCAMASLRQSRWKAGKWKAIDIHVTFSLRKSDLPSNAIRLPSPR